MWIFDLERKQGRHVLDPMALSCNWSPNRARLAVDLSFPINEIWLADADPNRPTWEAFGGETRADYLQRSWERDVQFYQRGASFSMQVFLRNMSAIVTNQYEWGQYDDVLWTAQHIIDIPEVKGTLSEVKSLAYMAMALAQLDRYEEAQQTLKRLRLICAKGDTTDESFLNEAEKVLASQDNTLVPVWEFIGDGQPNRALDLLEDRGITPDTAITADAVRSVRQALARSFCQSAQEARHRGHDPRVVVAGYEAALRADPNHVPALRDLSFLLATCTDAALRNGARARRYAQQACDLTAYQDSLCLVGLAAASAECDDFTGAVKWQREAIQQYPEEWSNHELMARLTLYETDRHLHTERVDPLVAWWPFTATDEEGTFVQDTTGHGLQGKLIGDAKVVTDPDRCYVLSLGGKGDWMECAHHARFNFVREISISLWIKVKTFNSPHQAIITKGAHAWEFLRRPFGKMVGFGCGGLDIQSNAWGILIGNNNVDDGHWHHLVGVYNGMTVYQYVDGELDTSAPARGRIALDDGPVNLGKSARFSGQEWNGMV